MVKLTLSHSTAGSVRLAFAKLKGLLCFGHYERHLRTLIGMYLFHSSSTYNLGPVKY